MGFSYETRPVAMKGASALGSPDADRPELWDESMASFARVNNPKAQKNLDGAFGVGDYLARGLSDKFGATEADAMRVSGWNPELGYRGGELRKGRDSALGELEARQAATPAAMYSLAGRAGNVLANRAAAAAGPMGAMGPTAANSGIYMGAMGNVGGATADSAVKQNVAANEAYRKGISERQELEAKKARSDTAMIGEREKMVQKYRQMGLDDEWSRFQNALNAHRLQQQAAIDWEKYKREKEASDAQSWLAPIAAVGGSIPLVGGFFKAPSEYVSATSGGEDAPGQSGDTSDSRCKQNIMPGKDDMQQALDAGVYNYELKANPGKKIVGVMADEMPGSMVKVDAKGKKSLKANASTLFGALATVNQKNKELEARLEAAEISPPIGRPAQQRVATGRNLEDGWIREREMKRDMAGLKNAPPVFEEDGASMPLVQMDEIVEKPVRARNMWPRATGDMPWVPQAWGYREPRQTEQPFMRAMRAGRQ